MEFKCVEAEQLYQKDPNLRKQDVEELQRWSTTQKHLPPLKDIQILTFLHKNHYEIEATKSSLDNYFTLRSNNLDVFQALDKNTLKTFASVLSIVVLPNKTPEGYIVFMMKLLDTRASNYDCIHHLKHAAMVMSLYYHQIGFEKGVVILADMEGCSLWHFLKLKWNAIRCTIKLFQNGMPVKIKGIHIINAIPLTDKIVALLKPFLKTKLYKKIQVHYPNSDTLYKFLPKECLCADYGGDLPSSEVLNEGTVKNMLDNYEFYTWHDNQKVDEAKRNSCRKES